MKLPSVVTVGIGAMLLACSSSGSGGAESGTGGTRSTAEESSGNGGADDPVAEDTPAPVARETAFCERALALWCLSGLLQESCESEIALERDAAAEADCTTEFDALLDCQIQDDLTCPDTGTRPFVSPGCEEEADTWQACMFPDVQVCQYNLNADFDTRLYTCQYACDRFAADCSFSLDDELRTCSCTAGISGKTFLFPGCYEDDLRAACTWH